eukprot:scaffold8097_cov258-Pinguiococcus_pyrenoidosus.AAC.9
MRGNPTGTPRGSRRSKSYRRRWRTVLPRSAAGPAAPSVCPREAFHSTGSRIHSRSASSQHLLLLVWTSCHCTSGLGPRGQRRPVPHEVGLGRTGTTERAIPRPMRMAATRSAARPCSPAHDEAAALHHASTGRALASLPPGGCSASSAGIVELQSGPLKLPGCRAPSWETPGKRDARSAPPPERPSTRLLAGSRPYSFTLPVSDLRPSPEAPSEFDVSGEEVLRFRFRSCACAARSLSSPPSSSLELSPEGTPVTLLLFPESVVAESV